MKSLKDINADCEDRVLLSRHGWSSQSLQYLGLPEVSNFHYCIVDNQKLNVLKENEDFYEL